MSEPDEAAVEAVAEVLAQNRNPFPLYPPTVMGLDRDEARLMLATPVVAEAFRDAERLRNLAARFEGHDDCGHHARLRVRRAGDPVTGWRVERNEDGEAVLTFGGLPFGQGFGLVASLGEQAPVAYAALADALARDAQVREIVEAHDGLVLDRAIGFGRLVALYPSPGDRDNSEEQR